MIYIYYISHEQPFGNFGKRNNRSDKYQLKLRKWCSLLLVCRQAHAEFAPLLYQAAHFTFNVGYVAGKYSVDARLVYKKEKLWKVSELLLQNLQQCTIKVEAGWRTDHGSNPYVFFILRRRNKLTSTIGSGIAWQENSPSS